MAPLRSITCPQCGQTFQAETWLIVDAAERPELMEQVKGEKLHEIPCSHCGHRGQVDAPLLFYFAADPLPRVRPSDGDR